MHYDTLIETHRFQLRFPVCKDVLKTNKQLVRIYDPYKQLGRWVNNQRKEYKKKLGGLRSSLTKDRLEKLEKIGVEWDMFTRIWEQRYNELIEFKKLHGHCNVTINNEGYDRLVVWLKEQRKLYRKMIHGKPCSMSKERADKLEKMGFRLGFSISNREKAEKVKRV